MNVDTVSTDGDGVTLDSEERRLRIEPVTATVVRVVYTGDEVESPDHSPMVASLPDAEVDWTFQEGEETLTLATDGVTLTIDRETAAFTWRDGEGNRLVREPPDGGKQISEVSPADVAAGADITSPRDSLDRTAYETELELEFSEQEGIYGLGQHEEGISNYRGHSQALYQSNTKVAMPAIVSTRGYGLLVDSTALVTFHDDQHGTYFWTECDNQQEFYFVAGPELDDVVSGFRDVTGESALVPKWAYGYVQSKERYRSGDELREIVAEYRDREIPLDVIIQDWQYWPDSETEDSTDFDDDAGQWGQKSFNADRFPDPTGTFDAIHDMDAKVMISIWPTIHEGSDREEMEEAGHIIDEDIEVPGPGIERGVYNVFDPDARELYWNQARDGLFDHGIDGWWCDSTEPYVGDFFLEEKLQPFRRTQYNTDALKTVLDPEYINAFSLLHAKGIYEGQRETTDRKRVLNLTRSGLPGQQRYGAITWSGDIGSTWDRLEKQIADGLQFTATGNPKWTLDIGGFFAGEVDIWGHEGDFPEGHEDEGYRELYTRWFQFGTFLPMFRSHGTMTPREVWRFGDPGETTYDTLVKFDELRYRLLPYIYSLAGWETHDDYTMYRHLAFEFQDDPDVYDIGDQFMFGPSLLVCPVTEPMYYRPGSEPIEGRAKAREVYLPDGEEWYDFWTGERYDGGQTILADAPLEKIPIFVPAGSIIPMGPVVQHTGEADDEPLQLRVYPGRDAEFDRYEDAGDGYGYEDGEYAWTTIRWDDVTETLTIDSREGSFPELVDQREVQVALVDDGHAVGVEPAAETTDAVYDGTQTTLDL